MGPARVSPSELIVRMLELALAGSLSAFARSSEVRSIRFVAGDVAPVARGSTSVSGRPCRVREMARRR
jgi:hypothetical protein